MRQGERLVIGLCSAFSLLVAGGLVWMWAPWKTVVQGGTKTAAARLYLVPAMSQMAAMNGGILVLLGGQMSVPTAVVTDSLQEQVPYSAGWKLRLNRNSNLGGLGDCATLYRDNGEMLWFHRDGRLIEKPEAAPGSCDGEMLPAIAEKANQCGYLDGTTLRFRLRPAWATCAAFSDGLAAVRHRGGPVGYIDNKGAMAIAPGFAMGSPFTEGMAAVQERLGALAGYIDRSGKMVIPAKYVRADPFRQGLAGVVEGESKKAGFIDKTGIFRIGGDFTDVMTEFAEDRAFVIANGQLVLLDREGRQVAAWKDGAGAGPFENGVAKVQIGERIHLVDRSGKVLTGEGFREISPLFLGHATTVTPRGRVVLIDQAGKFLLEADGWTLGRFEGDYILRARGEEVELADKHGTTKLRLENGKLVRGAKK